MEKMSNVVRVETQPTFEHQLLEPQSIEAQQQAPSTHTLCRSSRTHQIPKRYGFLIEDDKPTSHKETMCDITFERWLEAIKSKMDSMYSNQVWTLVDPPDEINLIGCKQVFKRKVGADGQVETYKARLVAKGFRQKHDIGYDETFSPIAMLKSIWILLAIAAYHDYEIQQMDVKTIFLN